MPFAAGLGVAVLCLTERLWPNDRVTNVTRGCFLSRYMIVITGGMTIGPFLLDAADLDDVRLFPLNSILVLTTLIPVRL